MKQKLKDFKRSKLNSVNDLNLKKEEKKKSSSVFQQKDNIVEKENKPKIENDENGLSKLYYDKQILKAFIQKDEQTIDWYKKAFHLYEINDSKVRWYWNKWAFLGNFIFLLYRKLYLIGILVLLAEIIAFNISTWIGFLIISLVGGYATYFLYLRYKDLQEIDTIPIKKIEIMKQKGGYNKWVLYISNVITFLFVSMLLIAIIQN